MSENTTQSPHTLKRIVDSSSSSPSLGDSKHLPETMFHQPNYQTPLSRRVHTWVPDADVSQLTTSARSSVKSSPLNSPLFSKLHETYDRSVSPCEIPTTELIRLRELSRSPLLREITNEYVEDQNTNNTTTNITLADESLELRASAGAGADDDSDDVEEIHRPINSPLRPDSKSPISKVSSRKKLMVTLGLTALMEEQIDLRLASGDNPTVVMELDLDGNVRYLSQNWEVIVGTSIKKIIGKPISNIVIGNGPDDLNVFVVAMNQMVKDDISYKVKFVTATNTIDVDKSLPTDQDATSESTDDGDVDIEEASPTNEFDPVNDEEAEAEVDSLSETSSKVSNNGEIIELEAQGILIHDSKTKLPTHAMWTIKPFTHIDVQLSIPPNLIDLLGFGAEIFEGYLQSVQDLGIIDEELVPQPKSILCRICESNIPAWFIERHSELCLVEHRIGEELQQCQDLLNDQKEELSSMIDALAASVALQSNMYNQAISPPNSVSGVIGMSSSLNSSASSISTSLSSSSSNAITALIPPHIEYKGVPISCIPQTSSPSFEDSPKLANQVLKKNYMNQLNISRRYPYNIIQRLLDLVNDALNINPALEVSDELTSENRFEFSPNSERVINNILNWKLTETTTDVGLMLLIEDTQTLTQNKIDIISRLISVLQYSNKIKHEVDNLVLETVKDTVNRVREQTFLNEQASLIPDSETDERTLSQVKAHLRTSSGSSLTVNLDPTQSLHPGIVAPKPSRTPILLDSSDEHNTFLITPTDILLRGRSPNIRSNSSGSGKNDLRKSLGDRELSIPEHSISTSPNELRHTSSSSSFRNSIISALGPTSAKDLLESFQDFDLNNKKPPLEGVTTNNSNNSTFLSPRRHLSPAPPYVERKSLSSFQRNTLTHKSSIASLDVGENQLMPPNLGILSSSDKTLATNSPPPNVSHIINPPPFISIPTTLGAAVGSISSERRSTSGGCYPQHTPTSQRNSLPNLTPILSASLLKQPLSPLLVSQAPVNKQPSGGDIRDYEVIKPISKGAFGSVFLAKKRLTGEYVAIKCLKKKDMIVKNQVLNVKSERAVMMRQSDSPYVAQLYASFQLKDYLYLVMEYLNGGDVATLVKMLGTLDDSWTRQYIAEIVVGVDDLHRRGIIHRDLKPDNVLIDKRGHLKLTDFGLSRIGIVKRQERSHRKSSAGDTGIELFRKSITNAMMMAATGPTGSAIADDNSTHHKRTSSITPFSLSPKTEFTKLNTSSLMTGSSSMTNSPVFEKSSFMSFKNSQPIGTVSNFLLSNAATGNSSIDSGVRSSSISGGSAYGVEQSPLIKPIIPRNVSESSFAILEDDSSSSDLTSGNATSTHLSASGEGSSHFAIGSEPMKHSHSALGTASHLLQSFTQSQSQGQGHNSSSSVLSYALFDPQNQKNEKEIRFVGTPDYLAPETIQGLGQSDALDWWSIGCMLFEFLFGYAPFHADTPDKVFTNILQGTIDWPPIAPDELLKYCRPEAQDLIQKLLTLDPQKRLGSNGSHEIMSHPYFNGIDWDNLFESEAPFVPHLEDPESTEYFDSRGAELLQLPRDEELNDINDEYHQHSEYNHQLHSLGGRSGSDTSDLLLLPGSGGGGGGKRERRSSRLADPTEFGSFHFRNLNVLEKANKDVINRLKSEHLEHRNSFSSSTSDVSTPSSRSRGYSFTGTSTFKKPVSPVIRAVSPSKMFDSPQSVFSTPTSTNPRHGSLTTAGSYSSSEEQPISQQPLPLPQVPADVIRHRSSLNSLTKHVFRPSGSTCTDSPTSLDNEDQKSSALLRVQKRRESLRRGGSIGGHSSGSFSSGGTQYGSGGSGTIPPFSLDSPHMLAQPEIDVLYCELISAVRLNVSKLLEKCGCVVVAITNGDEFVRRATSQVKFDLIFTALKLPKVSAIDAVKLIKFTTGVNVTTPIIALTAFKDEACEAGIFDEIIEKPVEFNQLQHVIHKFMRHDEAIESDNEN